MLLLVKELYNILNVTRRLVSEVQVTVKKHNTVSAVLTVTAIRGELVAVLQGSAVVACHVSGEY